MNSSRNLWTGLLALPALLAGVAAGPAAEPARVDFHRDIQPLLAARCAECHGDRRDKGGVRFDRRATVFQGGDSGQPLVVPGRAAESVLLRRVTSADPDEVMPPKGERLGEAEVALLRRWIDEGAVWPADAAAEKPHWAYVKPARPALPRVSNPRWCRNELDRLVLARLDREGLAPSPEAGRAGLLRRVSLDLTGLPPTVAELDAFLADARPDAYERVVERLLASPAYGERWARPWLDLARYADTQGYEKDNRRSLWPYRDWVIQALNRNLPFDQFTIEQLAGDLLPGATQDQKVATGFHRNTMTNTEGGTDNEEFRYEAVVDRINTTFGAWMGTTLACAQCHNHKYDPFSAVEYYRVMAFLNSTADADKDDESPTMRVFGPGQRERLQELRDREKAAQRELDEALRAPAFREGLVRWEETVAAEQAAWTVLDPATFRSEGGATLTKSASKSLEAGGTNPANDTYVVTVAAPAGRWTGVRLEVLEAGEPKAVGRHANGGFVLRRLDLADGGQPVAFRSVTADYSEKNLEVTNLLSGRADGWSIGPYDRAENKVRRSAYFTLAEPLTIPAGSARELTFTLRHSDRHRGANVRRFRLHLTGHERVGPSQPIPDAVRALLAVAPAARNAKQQAQLADHYRTLDPVTQPLVQKQAAARKAAEEYERALPLTSVMVELEKPRVTRRHVRGAYLNTAEAVTPGTPAALNPFPAGAPTNRLGFARWVVAPDNPLTARVIANRAWEQYFGRGLVETVEEFGKQGEPPSHPDLLDWLACEFMDPRTPGGPPAGPWDFKHLHRVIVTSATYRQSSQVTPALARRDPFNRLLARGPRVRLEAEMLRDQALAVSGLLSRKIGGPSVMPPQPEGLWQVVYSGDKWVTSQGEDRYRRGLYTFWRRSSPHPMMMNFDAPSREFCVLKRNRSNTPLQALNTLNDPAFVECAQAIARQVAALPAATTAARATHAFRTVLARPPAPAEVDRLVRLYEQELAHYRARPAAAREMATSELGQPKEPADLAVLAAWTVVANILLNLDEAITKG
ncbi:MAG: hypothetical protein RJA22_30 [Verrucomicrobiota bacterium]